MKIEVIIKPDGEGLTTKWKHVKIMFQPHAW